MIAPMRSVAERVAIRPADLGDAITGIDLEALDLVLEALVHTGGRGTTPESSSARVPRIEAGC